jgi:hypothetical protein
LPETPAGDGSVSGEKAMGFATVVVVVGAVDEVVVVVVGDLLVKRSAPVPSTSTATIATMTPRRTLRRRFARRCIASTLIRRAAF